METRSLRSIFDRTDHSPECCIDPTFEGRSLSLKRRREGYESVSSTLIGPADSNTMVTKGCTLGGHLDSPNDLRSILGSMLSDPQLGSLCDVVIIVGGERFPAHRAVLAAVSKVFKAMFTNSMKERNADEIVLSSLDPKSWKMAMQYIYHAQVDIDNEETALLLLSSARMYQLEKLEKFVESFLISSLRVRNCFSLLGEAERYDLEALKAACYRTMEEQFGTMAASPAFLSCPYSVLAKLIPSGNLVIKSEMFVFEAVMRWVGCMEGERIEHLDNLLGMIRLDRLSETELKQAGRNVLAQKSKKFKEEAFERLIYTSHDLRTESIISSGSHLKSRKRDGRVFTFSHVQRGMTVSSPADEEEVVRTPWSIDEEGRYLWRLKIYPRGYSKAKGQYLSMYVQGRSAVKSEKLDVFGRFDIFLMNRKDSSATISFSSQHHFSEASDHWGFHRFLQLPQLMNAEQGFLDEESDSVLLGANLYLP